MRDRLVALTRDLILVPSSATSLVPFKTTLEI